MTTPPAAGPDSETGVASAPAAAEPAGARTRRGARWVGSMTDRVPTGWITGILTVPFLAVAAAFGGLNAVAAPPIPDLSAGKTHVNGPFSLAISRAVLIDEFPEAGITVEEGQRVLAVVVTAENVWDRAMPTVLSSPDAALRGSLRIPSLGDGAVPVAIARFDDATKEPHLQPGVPADLVVTWAVDADALAAGDEVEIDIRDLSLSEGVLITYGEEWGTPMTAAHVHVDVTDVGAGADAEETSG